MMTEEERIELQKNNPLHGLKMETMLQELVDFYGWDILDAAMRFNCFHTKPSIASSVKYLKKTDWAREKVENFYLYRFKRMPRASEEEYQLPPRARTFRHGLDPKEPMELTVESILKSQAKAASAHKARSSGQNKNRRRPRD
ncbi:VF530 family DNA-binding protein [Vibrio sp. SCSIO 43132]|uniref:VF530 family protein n=1 Tax=Vibrio sp. SCSIO 43132 TaxID=2779363 RepID=UPI001CAA1515|nr:VF530 family DNA-binding protein [Vibrio sp. SCSIO 43132]UAB73722.1 VF530 family DNA-binding protein [Vibrio sp. SCSIO 43132]